MDPAAIREGLQANLGNIGAPFLAYAAEPNNPEPPCAWPWPDDPFIDREAMHKGVICFHYKVTLLVSSADTEHGIDTLDSYLVTSGGDSVWDAIESDRTLNGAVSDVSVAQIRRYDGNYLVGDNSYFAAEFFVTIYGTG